MIYTVGYAGRLTPSRLVRLVEALDAVLIDCRYRAYSRRSEFSGSTLATQFGDRYQWRGRELGGYGHTAPAGIERLRGYDMTGGNCILMCSEEAPGDCHRPLRHLRPALSGSDPHFPRGDVHREGAAGRDRFRHGLRAVRRDRRPFPLTIAIRYN
jgi:hypothetical protein